MKQYVPTWCRRTYISYTNASNNSRTFVELMSSSGFINSYDTLTKPHQFLKECDTHILFLQGDNNVGRSMFEEYQRSIKREDVKLIAICEANDGSIIMSDDFSILRRPQSKSWRGYAKIVFTPGSKIKRHLEGFKPGSNNTGDNTSPLTSVVESEDYNEYYYLLCHK